MILKRAGFRDIMPISQYLCFIGFLQSNNYLFHDLGSNDFIFIILSLDNNILMKLYKFNLFNISFNFSKILS